MIDEEGTSFCGEFLSVCCASLSRQCYRDAGGGAMMNFVFIRMESLMMLSLLLRVLDFLATELLA